MTIHGRTCYFATIIFTLKRVGHYWNHIAILSQKKRFQFLGTKIKVFFKHNIEHNKNVNKTLRTTNYDTIFTCTLKYGTDWKLKLITYVEITLNYDFVCQIVSIDIDILNLQKIHMYINSKSRKSLFLNFLIQFKISNIHNHW